MYGVIGNLAFMIIANQIIGYFKLADPKYLLYVRIGFAATHALVVSFLFFLKMRIQSSSPTEGRIEVVEGIDLPGHPATRKVMTPREYDLYELNKQLRAVITNIVFMSALHFFFKGSQMLIMVSVNAVKALVWNPLVRIHIYGAKSEGPLSRPFPIPEGPFGALKKLLIPEEDNATSAVASKKKNDDYEDSSSDEDEPIKVLEDNGSGSDSKVRNRPKTSK